MQVGATLGRRFALVSEGSHDVPGVQRFVALDTRLNTHVTLHVITSSAPSAVRTRAARAVLARDARIAKVLATRRENYAGKPVTYVVSERPQGLDLDAVLASRVLPVAHAAAVVAHVAQALAAVATQGHHHGHLRPAAITVTAQGRVMIAGFGFDGELAIQAGVARTAGKGERADAVAAASIFLTAITGKDVDDVAIDDIPESLPLDATVLCRAVLNGSGPRTLAAVESALRPLAARDLRDFAAVAADAPLRPSVIAQLELEAQAVAAAIRDAVTVDPASVLSAWLTVDLALAQRHASPAVIRLMYTQHEAPLSRLLTPEGTAPTDYVQGAVDDLNTFEIMAEEQNSAAAPALYEDLLRRLHTRFPRSRQLSRTWEAARARSQRSGPINAAPLLMAVSALTLVVASMVAFSALRAPASQVPEEYEHPYPAFTFSPSPSPSVSPSPDPEQ